MVCAAGFASGIGTARAAALAVPLTQMGPFVEVIDASERDDHVDISVQFSCSARYISNSPVGHGTRTTITLRLGPDCGSLLNILPPEIPQIGGGGQLVTAARVDMVVPGEVALEISWTKELDFVMAPAASGLGLRIRLLETNRRKGSVLTSEVTEPSSFSVNLDSALTPIEHARVEAAAAALQTQAYVSETDVDGQHWFRLRAGPFATRADAERVLQRAMPDYPRAWLASDDEQTDLDFVESAGSAPAPLAATDPAIPEEERARILREARAALEKHQYAEAVDLLTRLLRQPEYPARADAQELMGLTRERAGQLAQAKAEYQEYLRRYPQGNAAERVRARLRTLLAASAAARPAGEFGRPETPHWSLAGSSAVTYLYERDQTLAGGTTTSATSANSALVYADLLMRYRGDRYDITSRVDAGYTKSIASSFGGSQDRTTAAYVEVTDRVTGFTGRVGRQSLASQGIIGLFDGAYIGYQLSPTLSLSAAAGLPTYTGYAPVSGQSRFGTVAAEFDPFHLKWVFDTYFFEERIDGQSDRRSVGLQTRYTESGRTAVILVDYDIAFRQLNSATLIGNTRVGSAWILGFNADHRRSPLLELNNALIGQTAPDLNALRLEFTPSQIRQLALDRTPTSDIVVLSASRPLGDRWQFMADLAALRLGGTPFSGGVPATPSTGLDKNVALQMSGSSLLQASDLHIFGLRYDDSPLARSTTVSWDARFAIHGAWRLGPRLSVEELQERADGARQWLYLPQIRGDWTGRRSIFELTAGYQLQSQQSAQQPINGTGEPAIATLQQRSVYISAAYRLRF